MQVNRTIYFLPSYIERAPSSRVRVYCIARSLYGFDESVKVLPHNWSHDQKHCILESVKAQDIIYVQKWRTAFNSVEHLSEYKGKCKLVFDMDDATGDPQALQLIDLCDALVVGNHFLYDQHKDKKTTFLVPSPVDLKEYPQWKGESKERQISIAKCGIKPMLKPMFALMPILRSIQETHPFTLLLAGFNDDVQQQEVEKNIKFSKCLPLEKYDDYLRRTVPLLQQTQLSILPFIARDDGKSGHSLLANMAMGVPTIASSYAECEHIIKQGENGFIARNNEEWKNYIEQLFNDIGLRKRIRDNAWETIRSTYDVPVIARLLLSYLNQI